MQELRYNCRDDIIDEILRGITYPLVLEDANVVVDFGANIGATSIFFAESYTNALVYAFEPSPEYDSLVSNTSYNSRIKCINQGGYSKDLQTQMYLFDGDSTSNSIKWQSGYCIQINLKEAKSLVEEYTSTIDILKIDTEGCDYEILYSVMQGFTPKAIYIEYHSQDDYTKIKSLLADKYLIHIAKELSDSQGDVVFILKEPKK